MKTSKIGWYRGAFSLLCFSCLLSVNAQTSKVTSAKYYNDAIKAIEKGINNEAIVLINKSIEANPQFDMAYILRGKYNLANGKRELALTDFNQALSLNAGLGEGYACLAYYFLGENKPQQAFDNSNKAIFLNYKTANVYYYRAQARVQNNDYSGAVSDYTMAIDANHAQPDYYHDRALAKIQLADFNGAEVDLKKALEINLANDNYINSYYILLLKQNKYDNALQFLVGLIEKKAESNELKMKVANVKFLSGNLKGAEEDYRILVEKTSSAEAWTNLGNTLLKQLKYKESVDCFEKAIQTDAKYASAYLAKGVALENLGDINGACSDWKLAAENGNTQAEKFITDCK